MLTVGASHRTTPIAALGTMSSAAHELERRLREGGPHGIALPVEELAVLATCGRVEVYAVPAAGRGPAVVDLLAREVFDTGPPDVVRPERRGSARAAVAASARKVGRRVRAETSFGRRAASVGSAAVELACERLGWHEQGSDPSLPRRRRSSVVIGTGPAGVSLGLSGSTG